MGPTQSSCPGSSHVFVQMVPGASGGGDGGGGLGGGLGGSLGGGGESGGPPAHA